jgi:hypothetical protein
VSAGTALEEGDGWTARCRPARTKALRSRGTIPCTIPALLISTHFVPHVTSGGRGSQRGNCVFASRGVGSGDGQLRFSPVHESAHRRRALRPLSGATTLTPVITPTDHGDNGKRSRNGRVGQLTAPAEPEPGPSERRMAKMRVFLAALRETGVVRSATETLGIASCGAPQAQTAQSHMSPPPGIIGKSRLTAATGQRGTGAPDWSPAARLRLHRRTRRWQLPKTPTTCTQSGTAKL